jgi:hypothetical protein
LTQVCQLFPQLIPGRLLVVYHEDSTRSDITELVGLAGTSEARTRQFIGPATEMASPIPFGRPPGKQSSLVLLFGAGPLWRLSSGNRTPSDITHPGFAGVGFPIKP